MIVLNACRCSRRFGRRGHEYSGGCANNIFTKYVIRSYYTNAHIREGERIDLRNVMRFVFVVLREYLSLHVVNNRYYHVGRFVIGTNAIVVKTALYTIWFCALKHTMIDDNYESGKMVNVEEASHRSWMREGVFS